MAKSIDLSGLKRQTLSRPQTKSLDEAVKAIHEQEAAAAAIPEAPPQRIVRITVDLPEDLHMKLKMRSVQEKTTIRMLVIDLLERELA